MNRSLIFSVLILFIDSCSFSQNINYATWCRDEDELINQLFWDLIITSPPCDLQRMSMEENELYWSEYYTKLETGKYEVYVLDSLLSPPKSDYQLIVIASEYRQLYKDLFFNLQSKSRKFEIPNNPTMFNIKIISDYKIDKTLNNKLLIDSFLGEHKFSRIAFDENKSKACLIQSIVRNGCSKPYLICIEKQNNKWKIKRVINLTSL